MRLRRRKPEVQPQCDVIVGGFRARSVNDRVHLTFEVNQEGEPFCTVQVWMDADSAVVFQRHVTKATEQARSFVDPLNPTMNLSHGDWAH